MKKSGFTLAEVLITLGIIGVVAAMTIPTLLSTTNDQEYKTGIKKAMSALNQAVTMSVALDGTDFSAMSSGTGTGSIYEMFTKRMNVVSTGTSSVIGNDFNAAANYTLFFNDGIGITYPSTVTACTTATQCKMKVDINGTKKPNTTSLATDTTLPMRDQYSMYFYKQQVVPADESTKYVLFN